MYLIKLDQCSRSSYNKFVIYEFEIGDLRSGLSGYCVDESSFCEELLGGYPVDKYRVILKRKFKAKGYNNGKGPHFRYFGNIKPMVFEKKEDAEKALEWVESIQIQAMLIK